VFVRDWLQDLGAKKEAEKPDIPSGQSVLVSLMEKWMLIRGLSRQQLHWGDFPEYLHRLSGGEVIFEDLPGFGTRCHQDSPSSIEGIAEVLAPSVFSDANLVGGKINLVGISMGGMVALCLAKAHPEKVASLTLINSSFKPYAKFYERLQPAAYAGFLRAWFNPVKRYSEREILRLSSNLRGGDHVLLNEWLAYRRKQPPSRLATIKQILAASQFEFNDPAPAEHVLFIASKKDRIVSDKCSENAAMAWGADYRCHHYAGHDLPLDAPQWLAEHIVEWHRSKSSQRYSLPVKM
jgi:pimeloyl-ACP methyl ester carboxylesterase